MFEPIHGSAPKYASNGIINPIAAIESIRLMLEHLNEKSAAQDIQNEAKKLLREGTIKTQDLGGTNQG